MKKLILSAAIILGSFSTFAQQSTPSNSEQTDQTTQATQKVQTVKDPYTELKIEEVPEVVKEALVKAYPTAVLEKAFINEKKEYQLQVKVGERVGAVYADATGTWIKK